MRVGVGSGDGEGDGDGEKRGGERRARLAHFSGGRGGMWRCAFSACEGRREGWWVWRVSEGKAECVVFLRNVVDSASSPPTPPQVAHRTLKPVTRLERQMESLHCEQPQSHGDHKYMFVSVLCASCVPLLVVSPISRMSLSSLTFQFI